MGWNQVRIIADAIRNDLISGLRGAHQNLSLSVEQLEQEVVETRLAIIKEYMMKGILPIQDLLMSINCIPVDCESLDKCKCSGTSCGKPTAHFQIPQILFDFGLNKSIQYIGSSDKQHSFIIYTKPIDKVNTFQKYKKRGKNKPWVFIDVAPNSDGFIDCYIFNAPLIKQVSITAIFKDPRQLEDFTCECDQEQSNNMNFIDISVKERLLKQKFYYYRQAAKPLEPNDQTYSAR